MINRFLKVTNGLYRGGAPSFSDVLSLYNDLGIKKIVSLDQESGNKIKRTCKMLGIEHIIIPVDFSRSSLFELFSNNLYDLLITGGPTFIHCYAGKDRTGLVVALFQCKYLDKNPEEAIKEAKTLGFGIGVAPDVIQLYEKLIRSCKKEEDVNLADIVSNVRDNIGDHYDSYLEDATQQSFAPYLDCTKQYPNDYVYNSVNDQSPTRKNYTSYKSIKQHDNKKLVPMVGIFNNNAGIHGAGPTEPIGGFIND